MSVQELREKREQVIAYAQALIPADASGLTPELTERFAALMAEADQIGVEIERAAAAAVAAERAAVERAERERAAAAEAEKRRTEPKKHVLGRKRK